MFRTVRVRGVVVGDSSAHLGKWLVGGRQRKLMYKRSEKSLDRFILEKGHLRLIPRVS